MHTENEVTPSLVPGIRDGRPRLVIAVWAVVLVVCAAAAPAAQQLLGVPFELLSLVMLAPAIASLVVLVRPRWMPKWWPTASARRVVMATAVALVAALTFGITLSLLTGRSLSLPSEVAEAPMWLFLVAHTLGILSEEIGWRGVVQRAGEQFARPAVVSAVAGFVFGATHLGYWSLGPLPVFVFALTAMLMSLTITTIFDGNLWQRMIPAVIVHLGLNLSVVGLMNPDEPLATTLPALACAAVMLAVASIIKLLLQRQRSQLG